MWSVATTREFDRWFAQVSANEQIEIMAKVNLLKLFGPQLKRPHADTLKGSKFANMKELRADVQEHVLRIAFAFDPHRKAILLVGGDKSGRSQQRFYKKLIAKADELYEAHVAALQNRKRRGDSNG
jgi:hypothetical protein